MGRLDTLERGHPWKKRSFSANNQLTVLEIIWDWIILIYSFGSVLVLRTGVPALACWGCIHLVSWARSWSSKGSSMRRNHPCQRPLPLDLLVIGKGSIWRRGCNCSAWRGSNYLLYLINTKSLLAGPGEWPCGTASEWDGNGRHMGWCWNVLYLPVYPGINEVVPTWGVQELGFFWPQLLDICKLKAYKFKWEQFVICNASKDQRWISLFTWHGKRG